MTDPITCNTCRHFCPDDHNATAAMGRCLHAARHGYFFANEHHRCLDHTSEPRAKPESAPSE